MRPTIWEPTTGSFRSWTDTAVRLIWNISGCSFCYIFRKLHWSSSSDLGVPADLFVHHVQWRHFVVQDVGGYLSHVGLIQIPADPLHLGQHPGLFYNTKLHESRCLSHNTKDSKLDLYACTWSFPRPCSLMSRAIRWACSLVLIRFTL